MRQERRLAKGPTTKEISMITVQAISSQSEVIGEFNTRKPIRAQAKAELRGNVGFVSAVYVCGLERAPMPLARTTARIYFVA
jgi:hypothetical protein